MRRSCVQRATDLVLRAGRVAVLGRAAFGAGGGEEGLLLDEDDGDESQHREGDRHHEEVGGGVAVGVFDASADGVRELGDVRYGAAAAGSTAAGVEGFGDLVGEDGAEDADADGAAHAAEEADRGGRCPQLTSRYV